MEKEYHCLYTECEIDKEVKMMCTIQSDWSALYKLACKIPLAISPSGTYAPF